LSRETSGIDRNKNWGDKNFKKIQSYQADEGENHNEKKPIL